METSGNGESRSENGGDGLLGNFTPLPSDEGFGMAVGSENWNGVSSSFSGGWTPLDVQQSHGSGTFSDMDSFFILQKCHWIANSGCSAGYPLEGRCDKNDSLMPQCATDNCVQFQEECKIFDKGTMEPSADGKKRRRACDDWSPFARLKNMKTEDDQYTEEEDEEKQKSEIKPVAKTCSQIVGKEVKDSSTSGDAPKEDYVHVRAKRGQATNSHSLAERVRRERIRERMKFLQDLVPGCDKITGKAVMLDEIINYVLSLQRQVEFLSMKLATVYPETNVEPEQLLQRDVTHIRHSRGGRAAILGDPRVSSYPNLESSPVPNVASIWDNELQNTSQMDFISDLALDNPESNRFH